MGGARSAARVAAGEAQGWRETRRFCGAKNSGFAQGIPDEAQEATEGKALSSLVPIKADLDKLLRADDGTCFNRAVLQALRLRQQACQQFKRFSSRDRGSR